MTPGGAILIGTTVLVAAMDGGLSCMVGSALVGGAAYVATRRLPNKSVESVITTQMAEWERLIAQEADPDRKKKLKKEAETAEKLYRTRIGADRERIKWAAAAVGIGAAMAPIAVGTLLTAAYTQDRWKPYLIAAADVSRDAANRDTQAIEAGYVSVITT